MTGTKYNTPLQNQQIMLAEQRRKIENSNTMSKVKANNQKGIINEPVISHTKESKEYRKQHQQRNTRLKQEAYISAKLAKSVQLMDEGVTGPVEDSRSFAEKQADELYQQEKGFEANKLIKTLIENNMLFDFNSNFPRIFREIKSNYGDVGSFDAFRLIRKLLKEVANQDADKPLNNKDFLEGIGRIINNLSAMVKQTGSAQAQDWLHRVQALRETRSQISEDSLKQFDNETAVSEVTMSELVSAVQQGQDISDDPIIKALGKGALKIYYPESVNESSGESGSPNDIASQSTTMSEEFEMLWYTANGLISSEDPADVKSGIEFISNTTNIPVNKIRGWLRSGFDEVKAQIIKYVTATQKRKTDLEDLLLSERYREYENEYSRDNYNYDKEQNDELVKQTKAKNIISQANTKKKARGVKEDVDAEEADKEELATIRFFDYTVRIYQTIRLKHNVMQFYFFLLTEFKMNHSDPIKKVKFDAREKCLLENEKLAKTYTLQEWKNFITAFLDEVYDGRFGKIDPIKPAEEEELVAKGTRTGKKYKLGQDEDTGIKPRYERKPREQKGFY